MDCCTTPSSNDSLITDCPACGGRGRRVKPITLDMLLRSGVDRRDSGYRFCATPECDVAWFGETTGHRLPVASARVRIGNKETQADRPVCYCFGYAAGDIVAEVRLSGTSRIPEVIADHCRKGEDRCPEANPQGSCCLGNVRAVMKDALDADACGCSAQDARS